MLGFLAHRYQMPLALVGLILSLALWDVFKYCGDSWGLERYPILRQTLVHIAQCGKLVKIYNFFSCLGICELVMLKYFLNIERKRP